MTVVLSKHYADNQMAKMIKPKNPFQSTGLKRIKRKELLKHCKDSNELSNWVSELEEDDNDIPVLIKQYIKMGAKFLAFNVDPDFANCLDGLIMVDILDSDQKIMYKIFGEDSVNKMLDNSLKRM